MCKSAGQPKTCVGQLARQLLPKPCLSAKAECSKHKRLTLQQLPGHSTASRQVSACRNQPILASADAMQKQLVYRQEQKQRAEVRILLLRLLRRQRRRTRGKRSAKPYAAAGAAGNVPVAGTSTARHTQKQQQRQQPSQRKQQHKKDRQAAHAAATAHRQDLSDSKQQIKRPSAAQPVAPKAPQTPDAPTAAHSSPGAKQPTGVGGLSALHSCTQSGPQVEQQQGHSLSSTRGCSSSSSSDSSRNKDSPVSCPTRHSL
jgi:hypothetical protein